MPTDTVQPMKASQLRDLTRKYAAGKIPRDEYRAERTRLIEGIVSGEIHIRYRDLGPPPASDERRPRHWWYAAGIVMLVGLLLIALLAHFLHDDAAQGGNNVTTAAQPLNGGIKAFQEFNAADTWTSSAMAELEASWDELTPFQRENTRRSAAYRRLKRETEQRIREQEALVAAGEVEALLKAARLREFSERVGFTPKQ